jgi:hypothetical protein
MTNQSIYSAFERFWQYILIKFNDYVTHEVLNHHINDIDNPHSVTKAQVGLDQVDNTSDIEKPISYATQVALDDKADKGHTHDATYITTGVLSIANGGTGCGSIVDNSYSTPRYRASALVSYESYPYDNGVINWVYE